MRRNDENVIPQRTLRIVLCCLLVASLATVAVPGSAAPPPRPFCSGCGDSFEATAEGFGVELTVERSTATVSVHENGNATWVVRNYLADSSDSDAARLRTDASLRAEIADRAMRNAEFLGASVSDDGVLTARYRELDFAERSVGGALRSGAFTRAYGYRNLDGLGADRLVVVAPEGTNVGWTVDGATVSDDGRRTTLTRLGDGGFVTFVPEGSALGPLLSALAVGAVVVPTVATNALVYVAVPTAAFALLVAIAAGVVPSLGGDYERIRNTAGVALAGVGTFVTTVAMLGGGISLLGGVAAPLFGVAAPLFGVGVSLAALGAVRSRTAVGERPTYRSLVASAAFGTLVAAGVTVAGALAFDQNGLTRSLLSSLPFLVPVFVLLPAGYAVGRGERTLAVGTAAVGFALTMIPQTPFASPTIGFGLLLVIVATAYALVATLVGMPLFVVGMSLADGRSGDEATIPATGE